MQSFPRGGVDPYWTVYDPEVKEEKALYRRRSTDPFNLKVDAIAAF
jgi:hypothetical protein